jgi:Dam-replacing family
MATAKQLLGSEGEKLVAKHCACPQCKKSTTLKRLPTNFKCADLICDFCGYLAQVKTANVKQLDPPPKEVLGAAWGPQKLRMDSGIYFPLYLVLKSPEGVAIFYLPTDFQNEKLFKPRNPLSITAKRAGWQGFMYVLASLPKGALVQLK